MSDEYRRYLIPSRLDDPPKFLFWDFDVTILAMGSFVLGIILDSFLTFSAAGLVLAGAYQKLKGGKARGFGLHILYWYLPTTLGMELTPPSSVREYIG
jgi:conjugal transfer pilus assembly protein TraL